MNTFIFFFQNDVALLFKKKDTGELFEVALNSRQYRSSTTRSGHISFPGETGREGTIYYTQLVKSDANEGRMHEWLSQLTGLPTSEIQLEPYQLP